MQKEAIEGYRLSPQQEQLWALQQGVSGYALKCHAVTLIEGRLDRPRLDAALQALVRRYEILRTGFEQLDGMTVPLQVVQEVGRVPIEESDWSGLEPASQQEKLEALQESMQKDYLEFEKAPLLRVWLVTLGPSRHLFLLRLPSMCSDARALQNMVSELASLYETAGQHTDHDEAPIQYADLAEWQHELLESDDSVAGKKFWRSQKITSQEALALGLEKKPLPGTIFDPVSIALKMDDERLKSLQMLARESSVSLRTILLGAWQVLLWRHLQQSPMIVGVYGENRRYAELHSVVGLLAKTVPVVSTLEGSLSFRELISRLDATLQMVEEFQEVFSWHYLGLEGEDSQQLPFQFAYIDPQPTFSGDGVSFQIVSLYTCTSPFKLKLSCSESVAGLDIDLFYDSRSYVRPDVLLLSEQFNTLLGRLGANPERTLSELGIMPEEQRSVILKEWSGEDKPYPREKALAELYEEQVERTPNAPAVIFATESLTYAELNRRANQLGNYLRKKGVTPEQRIGLLMERSLEMVVGILGILKAGGAYVPLDPQYPQDRLKYMIEDAGIKLLLVQNDLKEVLQDQNQGRKIERIVLDDEAQQALITQESASNIKASNYPSQLAYVIYTSGSTGKPKGVMIEQAAILHRLWWTIEQFPMGTDDAVLQKTAFTFDASVWEILVPLMTGARLVMAKPGGQADSRYLIETIEREKITVLQLVPSMLRILQQEPGVERCRSTLKRVFSGGEALSREVVEQFRRKLDGVKLQNLYGPTETSIDAASWNCDGELNPAQAYMPLGHPLTNARIYLLDEQQELVPVGVTGEIHIGGAGLGRGYTRTPELTAERFVPNPFSDRGGERLYRTGDLGRYRADGVIEFLGRKDEQVKVRGYRIELGEIEAELASHPAVREAVVAALEDESGDKRLVGYVVLRSSRKETNPSERDFREYLSGRLPDYMIPTVVLEMEELPRTPNGKLDRRSLPQPDFGSSKEYVAPRTMTEEILAQLWADVLKVNRVSVAEDFFDAGGHSLLATQLMARVRETFGIEIALAKLFEQPTIEDLAREIEEELRGSEGALWRGPIQRRTETEKRGLSYAQQRLWFLDQLEPGALAYNLSAGIELEGELNVAVLERSVNEVIRRHESLRTRFAIDEDGEPEQIILPEDQIRIDLPVHEVARGSIEDKRKEMRRLAEAEAATPFNLRIGPLLRMKLLKLAERHHVVLFTLHHIVSDGWSQALIIEELGALYAAQLEGHKPEMKELTIQYSDYAAWQREWLKGEVLEKQLKYWRKHLSGMSGVLELPTQYPRPAVQSYRGAHYRRSLDADLTEKLRELASGENVTLYMLLLAALDVLLWRYSGQTDIAVGSPIANRTRKETEKLIGFFVNTLVLRVELDAQESFSQLLKRVRNTALGAYAHQDVPFEKLVEELKPERDMSRSPLFQVMFALQNMPFQELELPGLKVKSVEMETSIAKFDLTLFVSETAGVLDAVLEYNTSLFSRDAAERMWAHWEELLRSIVADPEKQIAALPLLRAEERHQILYEWNQTQQEFPGVANVVQLFEQQVERTPDAPAVRFKAGSLTYAELNRRANVLAQKLIASRVSAEAVVGLLVERNLNFLTSMLAVWKAGGAYLPLDSKYPLDRLQQIIRQSGLDWIIAEDQHAKLLAEVLAAGAANCKPVVVTITNDYEDEIHAGNPLPRNTGKNLAYVIYTSGSTGIPKGAMVEQVGMVNHLYAKIGDLELKPTDRIAQTASQSFDISVWQFIAGLLVGSEIEIVPEETAHDPFALWQLVQDRGVTILEVVPSLLGSLLHEDEQLAQTTSLRWLLVTGEAVTPQTCRQWLLRYPQVPMLNAYGPTECSDDVTHHVIRQIGQEIDRIPIGRTLANLKMYVLDQRQEPVPVGVSGELYVGGIGVGRGYLNDPSRTAESFVPDPFGTEPGARLYRTGDLGRYCENGVIDYLGRVDQQVKIRGFRIELAEIETALASHDSVQEAAVLARQDEPGDRRLVAYIVFKHSHSGNVGTRELKNYLQQKLPDYMVPSAIVVLAAVPRTANGKLDRKALPKPEGLMPEGRQFVAAQTEQEVLLAQMWADVLKLERVGVHDDFFDLGGHSLLATQLMAKVRKVFRVENMLLRKLFENPTVQGLARAIAEERQEDALPIPRRKDHARAPLSYMQRRLWFLEQLGPGNSTYNLSSAVKLDGFLDVQLLELSLNAVAERHDVLRTHFEVGRSGEPEQVIIPSQEFKIELPLSFVAGGSSAEKWQTVQQLAEAEATQPFDLSNGPLVRAKLLQVSEHEHVALFTLHHIISDGWSQAVLIEEIGTVYAAYAQSTQPKLEELPIQYGDYASWQREWLQGVVLERQLQYWRKQLEGMSGVLELPTDRPRTAIQSYRGAHYRIELPGDLNSRLQKLAREEKATLYMALLAAWNVLLWRYSGQKDIALGTPIANRIRQETEKLIGFFVNTLVVRTEIDPEESFRELLARVRETALSAYANQDVPFEKLVEELKPERDLSRSPLFQTMFALQNMPTISLDIPGLTVRASDVESHTSKFDLTLFITEDKADKLLGWMEYSTDLFDQSTIARMGGHWITLLESMVARPASPIADLPLLSAQERQEIVFDWNHTDRQYSREKTIVGIIEDQVEKAPQVIAVVFEGRCITYAELNSRSNQLAHFLRKKGLTQEHLVGVCMERSVEMVVALLGILKAGAAYVPLDASYPPDRLTYMLEDADVRLLLTQQHLAPILAELNSEMACLDRDWNLIAGEPARNPVHSLSGENLAYVIYTSGSTGRPKGAMNRHDGIRNRLQWMQEMYRLDESDRVLQKTPFSFDVSVWEFFWPLMAGARLVVAAPGGHQDPAYLANLIQQEGITTIHFVPSMLQVFIEEPQAEQCKSLRRVICSGEALGWNLQERFHHRMAGVELHNLYGPTEAAVDVTWWKCERGSHGFTVPLGYPIANIQIHILDKRLEPTPVGVAGEIHIAGIGLGRGYWQKAELTAEKFIPHPFSGEPGQRLYKTGDLGRVRPNGVIEYLGRLDHQVKIRGFRIELGEIEAALSAHKDVREAVVIAQEDGGNKKLVAYVVLQNVAGKASVELLQRYLREQLPEYMVPGIVVELESMPLFPNGKLDRNALPKAGVERKVVHAPSRTPDEKVLAAIWSEVLKIERVGIDENFFTLGGDSIRSIQIQARAKEAGVNFSLQELFRFQTIRGLTEGMASNYHEEVPHVEAFSLIQEEDRKKLPPDVEDAYPLASVQRGMLFHQAYAKDDPVYHNVNSYHLHMTWDREKFQTAVQAAVERHPILRTSFELEGYSEPLQLVHRQTYFPVEEADWRGLSEEAQEQAVAEFMEAEKLRRFDLSKPPQLRFYVHRRSADTIQFSLTENHAILDGWSLHATLAEIFNNYFLLLKGGAVSTTPLRTKYREYIALEQKASGSKENENFWVQTLEDVRVCEVPCTHVQALESHIELRHVEISSALSTALKGLARSAGVPLKSVLLAAHIKALSVITGNRDMLTGMAFHGRSATMDGDQVRGLFLNVVPFRQLVMPGSWLDFIRSVLRTEEALLPHSRYPFPLIQRRAEGRQLFDAAFNFVHFHVADALLHSGGVEILDFKKYEATNYKLTANFSVNAVTSQVMAELEYNAYQISAQQAQTWAHYYRAALQAMADHPEARHEMVDLLSDAERRQIVEDWNRTYKPGVSAEFAHHLFEQQVARTPDAPAVIFEDQQLSYAELNRKANRLAHYLVRNNVQPDQFVGLFMEKSHQTLVSLLAVLKAGAAYLWLDPTLPKERLAYILEDARIKVVLSETSVCAALPENGARVFLLDTAADVLNRESDANLDVVVHSGNIAYLIYTSGSTGKPKGVAVAHQNLSSLISAQCERLQLKPGTTTFQHFSFGFDASVWEWIMLTAGSRMVMARPVELAGEDLKQLMEKFEIEVMVITPSILRTIPPGGLSKLHTLCIGAEFVSADLVQTWAPGRRLFNCYGPTEATVVATMSDSLRAEDTPVIGKPLLNSEVFVADGAMLLCPIGARGELYIGGAGVSRGYWNSPDVTAEWFVPDPFSGRAGARLYRTGDVVKWCPDGNLDFIGRADRQVKIRGFRIELGEIESAIMSHPGLREAVVVVLEDEPGDKRLVAYVVLDPASGRQMDSRSLRQHLRTTLPEYMVPAAFVDMEKMPLNSNGKLDRKLLPRPDAEHAEEYVAPQTETEKRLAQIWSDVLKVEQIGLHDNFFELGGHSLLALQLISRVREMFQVEISMRMFFFESATLSALAARINQLECTQQIQIAPKIEMRRKPLDLEGALAKVSQLSDEEVKKLLSRTKAASE
jgi:amino acid adenylation domain-containing protein